MSFRLGDIITSNLQGLQPIPAVCGVLDLEELNHSDKRVGVVIRQRASQQALNVVQMNMEAAHTQEGS